MRADAALALAMLLACVAAPGLAAPEETRSGRAEPSERALDLWPFVVRDAAQTAGVRTSRSLGPIFESWRRTGPTAEAPDPTGYRTGESLPTSGWTLRPLASAFEREGADTLEFLYPLGAARTDAGGLRVRLTPFFDRARRSAPADPADRLPGRAGSDHWTLANVLAGRTEERERYAAVFPLGGVVKHRFGLERLEFWLFPFFARTRDDSGFERTYVLWPFFSWGKGGGRHLVRFWPFYGRDTREAEWDRRFAMWPFVHERRERLGEPGERHVRLWLPFYGESRSANVRGRIFGLVHQRTENLRTGERAVDWLWPFVRTASRPPSEHHTGYEERRFEPLFRQRVAFGETRTGALFGAFEVRSRASAEESDAGVRLLWAFDSRRLESKQTGSYKRRRAFWPFYRTVESGAPGEAPRGHTLAPFALPLVGEGWWRHLTGLLTLYERRWQDDEMREDLLWGLVRRRQTPLRRRTSVGWLSVEEREGERTQVSLFGLPLRRWASERSARD